MAKVKTVAEIIGEQIWEHGENENAGKDYQRGVFDALDWVVSLFAEYGHITDTETDALLNSIKVNR
jgi:hypothetical protein